MNMSYNKVIQRPFTVGSEAIATAQDATALSPAKKPEPNAAPTDNVYDPRPGQALPLEVSVGPKGNNPQLAYSTMLPVRGAAAVGGDPVAAAKNGTLVFSDALQALHDLSLRKGLTKQKRHELAETYAQAATGMGISAGNPFVGLVNKGVSEAENKGAVGELGLNLGNLLAIVDEKINQTPRAPLPAESGRIPSNLKEVQSNAASGNAVLAAQLVTGVYEPNKTSIEKMLKTQFDKGSTQVLDSENGELLGARTLVGTRKDDNFTMVAYRGTNNLIDTARDATMGSLNSQGKFELDDAEGRGMGKGVVHKGFADHVETVWPRVKMEILSAVRAGRTVDLTGHSLGAAAAELTLAKALNDPDIKEALKTSTGKPPFMLTTFAAPSVGDAEFEANLKKDIDRLGIPFRTYGFRNDPVAQMPPTGMKDANNKTFARPCAEFIYLDTQDNVPKMSLGRGPEAVKQDIRGDSAAHFAEDAVALAKSASSSAPKWGYSKLADHAPQNYFGVIHQLWRAGFILDPKSLDPTSAEK